MLVGLLALPALSSPGCGGSSADAPPAGEPTEEVKNGRVYRLSHDRVDGQIKAQEAKAAKRGAK
jgi:hypothetical protein